MLKQSTTERRQHLTRHLNSTAVFLYSNLTLYTQESKSPLILKLAGGLSGTAWYLKHRNGFSFLQGRMLKHLKKLQVADEGHICLPL